MKLKTSYTPSKVRVLSKVYFDERFYFWLLSTFSIDKNVQYDRF